MIKEIGNKYTPEDLKNKINELIKAQNQAKNDKNENKQSKLIDDDAICKIVMEIFQIYTDNVISYPYIQPDGTIRLLEGNYETIRRILEKQLGVTE